MFTVDGAENRAAVSPTADSSASKYPPARLISPLIITNTAAFIVAASDSLSRQIVRSVANTNASAYK